MVRKVLIPGFVLAISAVAPVLAQTPDADFAAAIAADKRGDFATEARLLRPLADRGNAAAQFGLGAMYDLGQGVSQDSAQAVSWYRKAADQGDATAQYFLGTMYDNGQGVPQDYVQAHKWYNLAGGKGYADAAKARDLVAAKMTPAQIAEAQKLAQEWKPK